MAFEVWKIQEKDNSITLKSNNYENKKTIHARITDVVRNSLHLLRM